MSGGDNTEPIAPLGRYHSRDVCHHCGGNGELTMVVVRDTRAWAWQCVDVVGCARRYYNRRQLELFGASASTPSASNPTRSAGSSKCGCCGAVDELEPAWFGLGTTGGYRCVDRDECFLRLMRPTPAELAIAEREALRAAA